MADFNALETLINAYIKQNGVQAITGQVLNGVLRGMVSALGKGWTIAGAAEPNTDPGTMTGPVAYIAHTAGTYTNFGGLVVNDGEVAFLKYNEQTWTKEVLASLAATASVDGNVGTPSVTTQFVNGVLNFAFHNIKGDPGVDGTDGDAAGFGTVAATVDNTIGTPAVSVSASGPDTAKNFTFAFTGLKGATGVTSAVVTVDNTVGTPQCAVSLVGQELHLDFTGLKGAQGDTGVSADYPITVVNNLTTNDPTSALSAAQGVQLESEISQLDLEVDNKTMVHRTSVNDAIYAIRASTATNYNKDVDDNSSGKRIRLIFAVRQGEILKYSTSLSSGICGNIYSNIPNAVASGETGRIQTINNTTFSTSQTTATANQDGFLSLSLTNGDTAITDERKAEMLASVSLDLAYKTAEDEQELGEYVENATGYLVTDINDALYIYKKTTSSDTVTDDSSGKRLRIVFPVKNGDYLRFTCTDINGYFAGVWDSVRNCMKSTPDAANGLIQEITPGTSYVNTPLSLQIKRDGYLCFSLTNGNTTIDSTRKAAMLASITIMLGGRANDYTGRELEILRDSVNGGSTSSYNKDMDDALVSVGGVNAYASGNYDNPVAKKANLSILAITDIHGTFDSISRAVAYANEKVDYIDYVACLGDVVLRSPADSITDFEDSFANSAKPFLFTVGNHDTADTNLAGITEAEARTKYFSQIVSKGWITNFLDENSCSWYKDDATHKIRMISVFEYGNSQTIATGAPNTYCRRWIPTTTLQWFADTLYSTPSNYSVVVLLHQVPFYPATFVSGKFTINADMRISLDQFFLNTINGNPFGDIVDAFINGTNITKTYSSIASYGLNKTADVDKDFSVRGAGKFICFVVGHFHGSYVFADATYPAQKTIAVPSGSRSVYQQKYGDTNFAPNNRHEDQFYVIGFDTTNKLINIAKIGGQVTNDMVKRDIISIPY